MQFLLGFGIGLLIPVAVRALLKADRPVSLELMRGEQGQEQTKEQKQPQKSAQKASAQTAPKTSSESDKSDSYKAKDESSGKETQG